MAFKKLPIITSILQSWTKYIGTTTKNGVVLVATSNVKLFLETIHMVTLKIMSLYMYKDLRLRILGIMSHVTIITRMAT